ncbi:MAG: hypothetical protein DRI90_13690 [Deltaproteobacteria bacterium]|nr:MAG: hypothetical protein DRI90_13690 [Deltaproteobacteria bacterium]
MVSSPGQSAAVSQPGSPPVPPVPPTAPTPPVPPLPPIPPVPPVPLVVGAALKNSSKSWVHDATIAAEPTTTKPTEPTRATLEPKTASINVCVTVEPGAHRQRTSAS